MSSSFRAGGAKAFWAPLNYWDIHRLREPGPESHSSSHLLSCLKGSLAETHHFTPSVCVWGTWLKRLRCTHTQPKSINDSHNPLHGTVFVLAAWVPRVNTAVHWSLFDKAAGVVCMVPYGFHSTQASPFQWAVVELMWDMLRQSRPLGVVLSAVCCDSLHWNSEAQAALEVFSSSLSILSRFPLRLLTENKANIDATDQAMEEFYLLFQIFLYLFPLKAFIFRDVAQ